MSFRKVMKSYVKDEGGNFAMMFGLLSVPILLGIGMAVDVSRAQSAYNDLQNAADAAVLFASVQASETHAELEAEARIAFEANLNFVDFNLENFSLTEDEAGNVSVSANGTIPALFAQINGFPNMGISIGSSAEADAGQDLEMVIAFDTTNSMGFGTSWTTALGTLSNVLTEIDQYSGSNNFYATLLPFSDRVNIGTDNDHWLTDAAPINWKGCVEPREGNSYGVDDEGFDDDDDDDLDDDEVYVDDSVYTVSTSYKLNDARPVGLNKFDASIVNVTGDITAKGNGYPHCPTVPITGPTSNVSEIITAADAFTKSGTGRFDIAMGWAWRIMSKKWRTDWDGLSSSGAEDAKRRQIAIMVTDGKTEAYTWEVDKKRDWGYNEGSIGGFENMVRACNGMKEDGMEIFMIRVNGNVHATPYMQDCASTDDHYYEISSNLDLEMALKDVLVVVKSNVLLVD